MTPGDVIEFAKQQYNAVNDTFFSDSELYRLIWMAQNELAREANVIEQTYSTSTVIGQQSYSYPSLMVSIKRVTYGGLKLEPITFREDDSLTLGNSATTVVGTPNYYSVFNKVLYLRTVPDSVKSLVLFGYNEAQEVSATSVLEVPTHYHQDLADFLLWRMAIKDKNYTGAEYAHQVWKEKVAGAKSWSKKRLRGDANAHVQDIDMPTVPGLGLI